MTFFKSIADMNIPDIVHRLGRLSLIAAASFWFDAPLVTGAEAGRVTLKLPPGFPRDIPAVVAGTMNKQPESGQTFRLSHPLLGNLTGQLDAETGQVFFATCISEGVVGRTIEMDAWASEPKDRVRIEATDEGCAFLADDRTVLFYQQRPVTEARHTRAGYVHPLVGLDGEEFTEAFPRDHLHHQGGFWAWHQLWVGDRKVGDPWITKDHLVVVKQARIVDEGPVFATLDVQAEWTSTVLDDLGQAQTIVDERTRIRVFRATQDVQYVDFTIQLTSRLPEVKLGGSEDSKGYSGFTVRVKPPRNFVIRDMRGVLENDAIQSISTWAGVSGSFIEGRTSGIGILSHPSSPAFPPRWVLRHYGMQNVAYPGRELIALSQETPLRLRHRLVLHRHDTQTARIADHQRIYELTR